MYPNNDVWDFYRTHTIKLMHAIALGGCRDTDREPALEFWLRKKIKKFNKGGRGGGLEPASVLRLAFQSDSELSDLSSIQ